MPKAVRISASIPVSSTSSSQSDYNQFVSIALFSGVGLLISLVVLNFLNVPGLWD